MNEIPNLNEAMALVLRTTRKEKKIPQEELARRMGCARSFIAAIEAREKQPSINTFFCLANALEVESEDLFRRLKMTLLVLNNRHEEKLEEKQEEQQIPQQQEGKPVRRVRKRTF